VTRAPATEAIVRIEVAEYVPTAMAKDDRGARPTLAVRLIDAHRSAIFLRHAVLCARDVVEIVDRKPAGIDQCAGFLGSHGFEGGKPSSAHHGRDTVVQETDGSRASFQVRPIRTRVRLRGRRKQPM
jgi:hypothetical protein